MKTWNALGAAAVGLVLGVAAPCAHASYLTVNGTCIASINPGCAPDLQTVPGANQLNLDQTVTLPDGDSYLISGTVYVVTYFQNPPSGPPQIFTLNPEFQVQYLGTTPSQADTLNLLFSQDFQNLAIAGGSFTNYLTGYTAGSFGAGSSIQMVNTVGTTSFPALTSALTSSFDVEETEIDLDTGQPADRLNRLYDVHRLRFGTRVHSGSPGAGGACGAWGRADRTRRGAAPR